MEACAPTTISNLNGRGTGFHFAMARAARVAGVRYVQRVAGDDVVARASVLMHRNEHFWGTQSYIAAVEQERVAAEIAQRIIVMNQREHTRVAAHCDDPSKVHVCFRGADQTHFFPADHPKISCRKFLFVGRQSFEKGYDILESAASLLERSDIPISISFAGTFTPAQTGLRHYLGFVELKDLPELYRSHDALVVCSRSEGFPQVIAEAMSCGLPCILSRNLFRQEFIQRDNCLLVETTPEDVAAGILELHTDANLYRRLQDGTVAYAKRFFSEERNRRDYHELILE